MSKSRTITITITEPQLRALSGAVGVAKNQFEGDDMGYPGYLAEMRSLEIAWAKIKDAWHLHQK